MDAISLVGVSPKFAGKIEDYAASFPCGRERVTFDPDRIPGLDHLEQFGSVAGWLEFCQQMRGKIGWFISLRESDGKMIGALCLRHSLEYDDDDEEFASHIGYSVRPDERRKGYAAEQLRLGLREARLIGLDRVRVICRDTNTGSIRTILANGGKFIDVIHGEDSGMNVNRYDIIL